MTRSTKQLSVTLPNAMAKQVRAKVNSGQYASESEVIRDGLRALEARERATERWLNEVAAPAFDALKADPKRGRSAAQIKATLARAHKRASKPK